MGSTELMPTKKNCHFEMITVTNIMRLPVLLPRNYYNYLPSDLFIDSLICKPKLPPSVPMPRAMVTQYGVVKPAHTRSDMIKEIYFVHRRTHTSNKRYA